MERLTRGDKFIKDLGTLTQIGMIIKSIDYDNNLIVVLMYGSEVWETLELSLEGLQSVIGEGEWKYVGNIEETKRFS